jgi:hypothetical protein
MAVVRSTCNNLRDLEAGVLKRRSWSDEGKRGTDITFGEYVASERILYVLSKSDTGYPVLQS